jgi:hypothetical protein
MSSGQPKDAMPDELVAYLEGGRLVVAATVDSDGMPYTMVMNSAMAVDANTIRFCIDHRTHSLKNIRGNGRIMFEVIGDGFIYGVRGSARVVVEKMEHAPIPSAMVEVSVETVKRDLPPGVEVEGPRFRWGALEQFMAPVEPKMFAEMRDWGGGD